VVWLGGWIATQYVGVHIFSLVLPGLVGLGGWWAASGAGGRGDRSARRLLLAVAGIAGLLGTAFGFRLVPGGQSVLRPLGVVLAPYGCALLGAALGAALFPGFKSAKPPTTAATPH
jgi:hypothetical protein